MSNLNQVVCPVAYKCSSPKCGHRMPHVKKDERPRQNHPEGISPCDTSYCTRFEDVGTCEPVVNEDKGYYNRGFDRGLAFGKTTIDRLVKERDEAISTKTTVYFRKVAIQKERDEVIRRLRTAQNNTSADKAEAWDEGYAAGKTSYDQGYKDGWENCVHEFNVLKKKFADFIQSAEKEHKRLYNLLGGR